MKITQLNKYIKKHIQPVLKDYVVEKALIYKIESTFFIKGYVFESTGNDEYDLSVWCFLQPLFVKSDCIYFNFGDRLKNKQKSSFFRSKGLEWWDAREENLDKSFHSILESILKQGEPYLKSFKGPADFYNKFKSEIKDDVRSMEAVTYTTVLLKDENLTERMLSKLIRYCEKEIKDGDGDDYEIEIRDDAVLLLKAGSKEARLEILKGWARKTVDDLKLSQIKNLI